MGSDSKSKPARKQEKPVGGKDAGVSSGQPKIKIQFYRSIIHASRKQKVMVRSLGFTKLNQTIERPDTPSMRGAVAKVPHLLRIVE
jgi:large subunit ribosomal protein L30